MFLTLLHMKRMHHGVLAQLVRALACQARGRGFKSRTSRHSSTLEVRFAGPRFVSAGEATRSDELFTLRLAREDDMPSIQAMAYAEGMPPIPSTDNLTVAVNGSDEVVGFIRLQLDEDAWHINPVVTYPT